MRFITTMSIHHDIINQFYSPEAMSTCAIFSFFWFSDALCNKQLNRIHHSIFINKKKIHHSIFICLVYHLHPALTGHIVAYPSMPIKQLHKQPLFELHDSQANQVPSLESSSISHFLHLLPPWTLLQLGLLLDPSISYKPLPEYYVDDNVISF